jgi:prepilin-type N-terminal cleavage/methylation domain-containing protein
MIKNNRGVTLIEILCALALVSMVLLLANSVNIFGLKQVSEQTSDINNQSNVRLAINIITNEIRSAQNVNVSNNILTINNTDVYKLNNQSLTKNGQAIILDIQKFNIVMNGKQIFVSIANIPSKNGKQIDLSDTIYIRE